MKDAYYFSHDSNARNDTKILAMRCDYGLEGYGMYWVIVETLRDESNYMLKLSDKTFKALAMQMHSTSDNVQKFINDCINEYELFATDNEHFWAESLTRRMDKLEIIRDKRKKAAEVRWQKSDNDMQMQYKSNAYAMQLDAKESKVKESKVKESIKKDIYIPFGENVSLKEEEHQKLIESYPQATVDKMIQVLDNYKGSSGKKYKSDYRAILSWVAEKVTKEEQPKQPIANKPNRVTKFHTSESRTSKYSAADLDAVAERKRAEHSAKKVIE